MFAFHSASDALSFGLAAQIALLQYPWSKEVLALDVCCEAAPDAQGCPTLRGPRVNVGAYEGVPSMVVPHPSMGRADYFGPLVNRAARLCFGAARGGQVVADKATAKQAVEEWRKRGGAYVDRSRHGWAFPESNELQVLVRGGGTFTFKGVPDSVSIVQFIPEGLSTRYAGSKERSERKTSSKAHQSDPAWGENASGVATRVSLALPLAPATLGACVKRFYHASMGASALRLGRSGEPSLRSSAVAHGAPRGVRGDLP